MTRIAMGVALALSLAATSAHAESASCKKVRFADVGWTDIQVTTGTAQNVLEALGYEPEVKTLSVPVTPEVRLSVPKMTRTCFCEAGEIARAPPG
ncbi:MAG: hypothetical protein J0I81_15975, partial [Hyphomicrobium sp.]|nr:hypothetical protein [Hyphomicrobium sp.]